MTTKKRKAKSTEAAPPTGDDWREQERRREQKAALWSLRQSFGWKQAELAEHLGVSLRSMTRWESKGDPIPVATVKKAMDLAAEKPELDGDLHWWKHYLQKSLRTRMGLDVSDSLLGRRQHEVRVQRLLSAVQVLTRLLQPDPLPVEQRIQALLDQFVLELADELEKKEKED